jgi:hypothetical protein
VRILLDECVHAGIKRAFPGHAVTTVPQAGWSGIKNGKLLALIAGNYDVFVTIDQNIRHQQNLSSLSFAIVFVAVPDNTMSSFLPMFGAMLKAVEEIKPGLIRIVPEPSE